MLESFVSPRRQTIIHGTKEGRLYVKPSEFFSQPQVQNQLLDMAKSDIVKRINARRRNSDQHNMSVDYNNLSNDLKNAIKRYGKR